MITKVACTNPKCANYEKRKSVAFEEQEHEHEHEHEHDGSDDGFVDVKKVDIQ